MFAQIARQPWHETWTLLGVLIAIILIAAAIGIVVVAVRAFGLVIPSWAVAIFWIVVVAVVAIMALKFLFAMAG